MYKRFHVNGNTLGRHTPSDFELGSTVASQACI